MRCHEQECACVHGVAPIGGVERKLLRYANQWPQRGATFEQGGNSSRWRSCTLITRVDHGDPYDLLERDLIVLSELGIWSQGGDVNRLARLIEGLRNDQNMPALMRRAGQESVRSLSISVIIERLTECDFTIQELAFTSEPISPDRRSAITGSIS